MWLQVRDRDKTGRSNLERASGSAGLGEAADDRRE